MHKTPRKNKRVSRFFIEQPLSPKQEITLPPTLVNYIVNVLRLQKDDSIVLFNGLQNEHSQQRAGEFSATLTEVSKRSVIATIDQFIEKDLESPLSIHLFQGMSRSERMDFTIQKAVELGIDQITPVFTQRSNIGKLNSKQLEKKQYHWQSVANSACEQSGRTQQVKINNACKVEQLSQYSAELSLLLSPESQSSLSDIKSIKPAQVNIFIGPEGGLTEQEINWATENGYQTIRLGNRILRTETAGLTTISILQYLWGDLG